MLIVSIPFAPSTQGMEKIKSWLGLIKKQYKMDDGSQCSICLDPLQAQPPVPRTILACNHTFHHTCISTWTNTQNTCPLCRVAIHSRIKDFPKQSSILTQQESNPNPYFIDFPDFLLRVIVRSPQAIPTFASAVPLLLYLDGEKPTVKKIAFAAGFCGFCSLISLIIWHGDRTKPYEKTAEEKLLGYIKPSSKNYALINASIIMNACIIKAMNYAQPEQLNGLEATALGITCAVLQHDAITHLLYREKE